MLRQSDIFLGSYFFTRNFHPEKRLFIGKNIGNAQIQGVRLGSFFHI
jgi:hypothetical protein